MNEQEEIQRLQILHRNLKRKIDRLDDPENLPFDKLDDYGMLLERLGDEMEELEIDYEVTDFLIAGSRMTTCPEK
jgi:hypothetical protein